MQALLLFPGVTMLRDERMFISEIFQNAECQVSCGHFQESNKLNTPLEMSQFGKIDSG